LKPILPKPFEPKRIDYDAWEEIHSRVHALIDTGVAGAVPTSRKVNTTAPLSGGGNLTTDLTLSIVANGVTNALLAQMPPSTIKGNATGGLANAADLTVLPAAVFPALTGDVTTPGASLATTIAVNAVTNAKAAQMAGNTLKGNNTGAPANAADLTVAQVNTLLGTPVGANPSATVGLTAVNGAATTFLRSDGAPKLDQSITPTWSGAHVFQSILGATGSPLVSTATQAETGLANKKTSDSTSGGATLTADAALTVTCNETGTYAFQVFLAFYEAVLGTGGFQFDLAAGSATIGAILFGSDGYTTAAIANAAATSASAVTAYATVATSAAAPSWTYVTGTVQITVAGTFGVRWAQNTISVNLTTLKALSSIQLTKIG
jgi:hypothetical protein